MFVFCPVMFVNKGFLSTLNLPFVIKYNFFMFLFFKKVQKLSIIYKSIKNAFPSPLLPVPKSGLYHIH